MNAGCYNDNHLISKAKSIKIAKILKKAIETARKCLHGIGYGTQSEIKKA